MESNRNSISLNKYISRTGICSRREADELIANGRVTINGEIAEKGNRVSETDKVLLDDEPLNDPPVKVYIALNKPAGITSTTDKKDKDNIIDFMDYPKRIFPIGRLDKDSTGLILLTNDGNIVNKILREENNHDKEYIVTVNKPINAQFVKKMENGLPILDTVTKQCSVQKLDETKFRIILTQGLNRQIRRMCELLGYEVETLKRTRIMNIHLGSLPVGSYRNLKPAELIKLKKQLD